MKYFHFDESIYKKLNENIFDDDIINDSDYNITNKLMDKEEVLKIFNILYFVFWPLFKGLIRGIYLLF